MMNYFKKIFKSRVKAWDIDAKLTRLEMLEQRIDKKNEMFNEVYQFIKNSESMSVEKLAKVVNTAEEKNEKSLTTLKDEVGKVRQRVDAVEKYAKEVKSIEKNIFERSKFIEKFFNETIATLKGENNQTKSESLLIEFIENQANVLALKEEADFIKEKIFNLENVAHSIDKALYDIERRFDDIKNEIPYVNEFNSKFEFYVSGIRDVKSVYEEITSKLSRLHSQKELLKKMIADYAKIETIYIEYEDKLNKVEEISASVLPAVTSLNEKVEISDVIVKKVDHTLSKLQEVEGLKAKVENFGLHIGGILETKKSIENLVSESVRLKNFLNVFESKKLEIIDVSGEINSVASKVKILQDSINSYDSVVDEIENKRESVVKIKEQVDKILGKLEDFEKTSERIDYAISHRDHIDESLRYADETIKKIEKKINEFKDVEGKIEQASNEFDAIHKKLKEISSF